MANDRKTIGLTSEGRQIVQKMMDSGYFHDQIDAARFALALAIEKGVEPDKTEGASTVWNVGSLDPDGEIRKLIPALYDEAQNPYQLVEHFINQGLLLIGQQIEEEGSLDLEEILSEPS